MARSNFAAPAPTGQPPSAYERSIRGRIGAFSLHAQGGTNTGPARKAFLDKFEQQVDPDRLLSSEERSKRVRAAKSAYFSKLALKSSKRRKVKSKESSTAQQGCKS
jgi:hypothetical protein